MLACLKKSWEKLNEFLGQSSIHGLVYISSGNSTCGKITWILAVILSLLIAGYMIQAGLNEAKTNPLSTSIELVPVSEVPFPAITINTDQDVNPWGFLESTMNRLAFDDKYEWNISMKLRNDFKFLSNNVVKKMFWKMYTDRAYHQNWTVQDYKDYSTNESAPMVIGVRVLTVLKMRVFVYVYEARVSG